MVKCEKRLEAKSIRHEKIDHPLFTVESLCFGYEREKKIFDHFSLRIPREEVVCIVGQNGCGKSTLLHLLAGRYKPQAGEIFFEDQSLSDYRSKELALKLAMVHQKNTAPEDFTVEELVQYGRTPYRGLWASHDKQRDQEAVERALCRTDLYDLRHRAASALSGGQMQRVWLAMALAQETQTLFLDEPTSFLDIRYQKEILHLVRKLQQEENLSVVMVLHDINQALAYSDHIIALKEGKLIQQSSPEEFARSDILEQVYDCSLSVFHSEGQSIIKTF